MPPQEPASGPAACSISAIITCCANTFQRAAEASWYSRSHRFCVGPRSVVAGSSTVGERRAASSLATSQRTSYGIGSIPPPLSGDGARRVKSTTPPGVWSPEATPSVTYGNAPERAATGEAPRVARAPPGFVGRPVRLIAVKAAGPVSSARRRSARAASSHSKRVRSMVVTSFGLVENGAPKWTRERGWTRPDGSRTRCRFHLEPKKREAGSLAVKVLLRNGQLPTHPAAKARLPCSRHHPTQVGTGTVRVDRWHSDRASAITDSFVIWSLPRP